MDIEFQNLNTIHTYVVVNKYKAKYNVVEIRINISIMKEKGRGIINTLPLNYKKDSKLVKLIPYGSMNFQQGLEYPHNVDLGRLWTGKTETKTLSLVCTADLMIIRNQQII